MQRKNRLCVQENTCKKFFPLTETRVALPSAELGVLEGFLQRLNTAKFLGINKLGVRGSQPLLSANPILLFF